MQVLEIQIPMISAHLHNPSSVTDQLTMKPLPQIEEKIVEVLSESRLSIKAFPKTWPEKELISKHLKMKV